MSEYLTVTVPETFFRPRSESSTPSGRPTARRPSPALRDPRPARGRRATRAPSSSSPARRAADPARGDSEAATTTKRWVGNQVYLGGMYIWRLQDFLLPQSAFSHWLLLYNSHNLPYFIGFWGTFLTPSSADVICTCPLISYYKSKMVPIFTRLWS